MIRWWRARKMRWAVRKVNSLKIRTSEIGLQVVFGGPDSMFNPSGSIRAMESVCGKCYKNPCACADASP